MSQDRIFVLDDEGQPLGDWKVGTEAHQVLSELRAQLQLLPHEGSLWYRGAEVNGKLSRIPIGCYIFKLATGRLWSAYMIGNSALPSELDAVTTHTTTGGFIALKNPVTVDRRFKQLLLQFQQQLAQQPCVYKEPTSESHYWEGTSEAHLVQALIQLVFNPINHIIMRCSTYLGSWAGSQAYIGPSRKRTRDSNSSSNPDSGPNSRRNTRSGSERSSRATSSGQVGVDDSVAAEDAAAAAAAAADAFAGSLRAPDVPVYRVDRDPIDLGLAAAGLQQALEDQRKGLTTSIPQPKVSLRANLHFMVTANAWQQEQQLLPATSVVDGFSSSVFVAGPRHALGPGRASNSLQLPTTTGLASSAAAAAAAAIPAAAAAAVPAAASSSPSSPIAAVATASSAAAALAASFASAAPSIADKKAAFQSEGNLVLVTGGVKPASIVCQAFNVSKDEFLRRVASYKTPQERQFLNIAKQCSGGNVMALDIVSQAVEYAFFTGTSYFVINCLCLHWIGTLVKVVEVEGADGRIRLEATVKLSEAIFSKDAGPDNATVRAAYLLLAELTMHHRYHLRQIAKPDDTVAPNTAAAAAQQGGLGDDNTQSRRDDQQQQQQQEQQPMQMQQQGWQQRQQQQQQQRQQQSLSSSQQKSIVDEPFKHPYQYFTAKHVQLLGRVSDGETAQVFWGTFLGQQAIIKTLSLHWEPAGGYIYEVIMYDLLDDLQLEGVLPRLLAHGEYYDMRYCMVLEPAPGILLSQVPQPYSPDVQQAVQAAVARIHEHDVIHDDLHENNIFVQLVPGAPPKVTIIDLGRAQLASSAEQKKQEMQRLRQMLHC